MKVVAFNGSPRRDGNTMESIKIVLAELEKEGISTEIVQVGGKLLHGCSACGKCRQTKDMKCAFKDDEMNEFLAKMVLADGIIIGSPTYFSNVTTEIKALIDRCGYVAKGNNNALKGKVGASVVAVRRAGSNFTYSAINFFFGINEMMVPGSSYWNMTLSRDKGEVLKDEEGIRTFQTLGKNMAWLLKKIHQ
jgi:multimeric flavodoxin WrbA